MKVYWYELLYRGVSPGAFPKGAVTSDHDHTNSRGFKFGAVAYSSPLSDNQIENYELKEIEAPRELYDFEKYLLEESK